MSYQRTKVDLLWSDAGDLCVDAKRGDLADTTTIQYRAFIQQVVTRLSSASGDWQLQPTLGASLTRFQGRPNTAQTGQDIKNAVIAALTRDAFLRAAELRVEVFPTSNTDIAIALYMRPSGDSAQVNLVFTYNTLDNKIIPRNL